MAERCGACPSEHPEHCVQLRYPNSRNVDYDGRAESCECCCHGWDADDDYEDDQESRNP